MSFATVGVPLISAGINAISSLFGNHKQSQNVNKQIAATKEENQKNRDWNLNLAKMQNQWNLEQWNRENDYNSPTRQMSRLKAAGLNPDLAYAQGGSFTPAAASPEMTSGAGSSPADMSAYGNLPTYGDVAPAAMNAALTAAQIKNIDANTKKTDSETDKNKIESDILSVDLLTRGAKNEQALQIGDMQITVGKSVAALNTQQKENLIQDLNNAKQIYEEIKSRIAVNNQMVGKLREDQITARFNRVLSSSQFLLACKKVQAEVNSLNAGAHLSLTQAKDLVVTQAARLGLMGAQTYGTYAKAQLDYSTIGLVDMNRENISFHLESDKKWLDKERRRGHFTGYTDSIANGISVLMSGFSGMAKSGVFAGKPRPIGYR